MEAAKEDLQDHVNSLRTERQAALDELADAKFEVKQLLADAETAAAAHKVAHDKLLAEVQRGNEMVQELEQDKEKLRRQFVEFSDTKDLIAASEGLERRIFELEALLEAEKLSVAKCEGEVAHLKGEKASLEEQAEELKSLKREHAVLKKDLEEANTQLTKERELNTSASSALEERLAVAGKEVNELKISLARANEENKLQLQEVCNLRAVNEATQREIDRCISEQTAGGDRMLTRIRELEDKSEKAECEVARLREKVDTLDAHKAQLQASLNGAEAGAAEVKEKAAKTLAELEMKDAQLSALNEDKAKIESRCGVRVLVWVHVLALARARACASLIDGARHRLKQLESEHSSAMEAQSKTAEEARARASALELEVAKMKSKCELLEQERESLQRMADSKDSSGAQVRMPRALLSGPCARTVLCFRCAVRWRKRVCMHACALKQGGNRQACIHACTRPGVRTYPRAPRQRGKAVREAGGVKAECERWQQLKLGDGMQVVATVSKLSDELQEARSLKAET